MNKLLGLLFGLLILTSCKKDDSINLASIKTIETKVLFDNETECYGIIQNSGSSPILEKGFCWSKDSLPNISFDQFRIIESDEDTFSIRIKNLLPLTKYYISAFGTNKLGTFYGNVLSFKTDSNRTSHFKDNRDNRIYKTVYIGDVEWMAENLSYASENSSFYNDDSSNYSQYGRLYTWDAAVNACPTGWELPGDDDWMKLESALGMTTEEITDSHIRGWVVDQILEGGIQGLNITFSGYKWGENWMNNEYESGCWTSTQQGNGAYYRGFQVSYDGIVRSIVDKEMQYSVRCIRK